VARVNKSGGKTGQTSRKRGGPSKARGGSPRKVVKGRRRAGSHKPEAKQPSVEFRVRELNAQQKCGPGTSVERLFRVDEQADGPPKAHLVFLDRRHGWYCEHGVECPAVGHARRIGEAGSQHIGRTNNGGMRA
jgi:hypothetical protein